VLAEACAQLRKREGQRDGLFVSVNVSPRSLAASSLVADVESALGGTVDPSSLVLELTKSRVLADVARGAGQVDQLRGLGVRVAVDDFGTGHASLAALNTLAVDLLKLARPFVSGVDRGGRGAEIARAVLALAHALGIEAVAEGVETKRELDALRSIGYALGQGYLLGRPAPPAQVCAALERP
jgi:EAL domain-containing protein (putative c-di-GMP-specific phosphodiesterase class I)